MNQVKEETRNPDQEKLLNLDQVKSRHKIPAPGAADSDPLLLCPVCQHLLRRGTSAFTCDAGHCHDLSAKGHVNLLPGSHKGVSGDNAEMVHARRRFLDAGHYEVLRNALTDMAHDFADRFPAADRGPVWLDCGCGEGWYTGAIATAMRESHADAHTYGTDISKDAVRLAAGRYRNATFFVASVFQLPIAAGTADAVSCLFAPMADAEFLRILKPGGMLVTVTPGPKHLFELKEVLYATVIDNPPVIAGLEGFDRVSLTALRQPVHVSGTDHATGMPALFDLLAMTPYYWRTPAEGVARLKERSELDVRLEFDIACWRKK